MKLKITTILFVFFFSFQGFSQSGKLDKAKESLKTTTTSNGTTTVKNSRKTSSNVAIENPFKRILFYLFAYTAYGVVIESPFEFKGKMHDAEIAKYPYKEPHYGNFLYATNIDYALARLDISDHFVIENSHLYGNHLQTDFRFFKRMGVEVTYLKLYEKLNRRTATFSLASAMLNYHRIRTQKLDLWVGLGTMYVGEEVHKFGFSYGAGATWFIKKPISITASIKATNINNRSVNTSKVMLQYYFKNYRFGAGYEAFTLGVSQINTFSIGVGISIY